MRWVIPLWLHTRCLFRAIGKSIVGISNALESTRGAGSAEALIETPTKAL